MPALWTRSRLGARQLSFCSQMRHVHTQLTQTRDSTLENHWARVWSRNARRQRQPTQNGTARPPTQHDRRPHLSNMANLSSARHARGSVHFMGMGCNMPHMGMGMGTWPQGPGPMASFYTHVSHSAAPPSYTIIPQLIPCVAASRGAHPCDAWPATCSSTPTK